MRSASFASMAFVPTWLVRAFLLPAVLLLSLACWSSSLEASAVVGTYNTFTSGNPPIGDGNDYPFSLNPASQVSGGAAADTYYSTTVGFTNLNGNPAFFDANNLLTRSASLIQGESFWTDPRMGNFVGSSGNPFSIAIIGFDVPFDIGSLGFDIAVASASGSVPDTLNFSVQDSNDNFFYGTLSLNDSAFGDIFPEQSGTFPTLGGLVGREARFRIDTVDLEFLFSPDSENPDAEPPTLTAPYFLDIDLAPIATLGGTTQIAIDNVVLDLAELPQPTPQPTYLPPTPPIGPNTPQYFNYASTDNDQSGGDAFDFTSTDLGDTFANVTTQGNQDPEGLGAGAFTDSTTLFFPSDAPDMGLVTHEVIHELQTSTGGNLPADALPVGPGASIVNYVLQRSGAAEPSNSPTPQIVEVKTSLDTSTDPNGQLSQIVAEMQQDVQQIETEATNGPRFVLLQPSGSSNEETLLSPMLISGDSEITLASDDGPGAPTFYKGFTVNQYYAQVATTGGPVLGDSGSYIVPVSDDMGNIVNYIVSTWVVTNQSGLFQPILVGASSIPEPAATTLGLIALLGIAIKRRHAPRGQVIS